MASANHVVGIDLGGTNMQIGVVGADNKVVGRTKLKTKPDKGGDAVVERMIEGVEEACSEASVKVAELRGIGIGAPGAIDMEAGIVLEAPNLRWNHYPLAERLSKGLAGKPVLVDNDVNVAVYGENRLGAGGNARNLLGVWLGTGVGGGLILNGSLYYGEKGSAGEIGWTILFPGAPLGWRTLEQNCSRKHVSDRLKRLIAANYESRLHDIAGGPDAAIGSSDIAEAYQSGDALVREVLDEAAEFLGTAIANCCTLLSLDRVILGGGLGEAMGQPFADRVAEHARRHVFPRTLQSLSVLCTKLADDAGLLGAALLAREKFVGR